MAEESDAQIFAAGLYYGPATQEEQDGPALMSDLCARTGAPTSLIRELSGLHDAIAKIGVALHNQYVLGYHPPDDCASGKYRKIKGEPFGAPWSSADSDPRPCGLLLSGALARTCWPVDVGRAILPAAGLQPA